MNEIISSFIVGVLALIGVIITNSANNKKIQSEMQTQAAVTDTKLEELTREVREHNNFAKRVPILEEQMKVANHRIKDLEDKK